MESTPLILHRKFPRKESPLARCAIVISCASSTRVGKNCKARPSTRAMSPTGKKRFPGAKVPSTPLIKESGAVTLFNQTPLKIRLINLLMRTMDIFSAVSVMGNPGILRPAVINKRFMKKVKLNNHRKECTALNGTENGTRAE